MIRAGFASTPSAATGGGAVVVNGQASSSTSVSLNVACSQEALFFPLPITGGIENIVQFTNLETVKLAFKVRSTIRHRYAVRPTSGFLHPKEEMIVKFLLDPTSMVVDGAAPDESTRDSVLVDFIVVPATDEGLTAAQFWKRSSESSAIQSQQQLHRMRFPCIFTRSGQPLPKSLTIHVNQQGGGGGASAQAAAPPGTPSHFSSARQQQPQRPSIVPPVSFEAMNSAASSAVTPRSGSMQSQLVTPRLIPATSTSTGTTPLLPPGGGGLKSNFAAAAVAGSPRLPPPAPARSAAKAPLHYTGGGGGGLVVVPAPVTRPEDIIGPVVNDIVGSKGAATFLETFLCFRIPLPCAAVLLLVAFVVALVEDPDAAVLQVFSRVVGN